MINAINNLGPAWLLGPAEAGGTGCHCAGMCDVCLGTTHARAVRCLQGVFSTLQSPNKVKFVKLGVPTCCDKQLSLWPYGSQVRCNTTACRHGTESALCQSIIMHEERHCICIQFCSTRGSLSCPKIREALSCQRSHQTPSLVSIRPWHNEKNWALI